MKKASASSRYRVMIARDGADCLVVPGIQFAKAGDVVSFKSVGTNVKVMFPDEGLFGSRELVLQDSQEKSLTVRAVTVGTYPYAAFCTEINGFALGGSSPKIIIYE